MIRIFALLLIVLSFFPGAVHCQLHSPDPYEIFHKHYEAIGGLAKLKKVKTSYSSGLTSYDGLQGRFTAWEKKPLQYRVQEDYKVIKQVSGDDGSFSWLQDTNGRVQVFKDEETLKRRQVEARFARYEHLDRNSSFFTLYYDGRKLVGDRQCHVVRLENSINHDVSRYYFDATTFLLVKQVVSQPDVEFHTTYSDHRPIAGFILPFQEDTQIWPRDKTTSTTLEVYRPNVEVRDELFAIPAQGKDDFQFLHGSNEETITFKYIENSIYLPVEINGEEKLWLLDSGASGTIIDAGYARELGLDVQGKIKGFGFGDTFNLAIVTLPPYKLGALLFKSQTIFAYKDLAATSYEPEIAGILGYDFLSRLISKIDFSKKRITFYDPAFFSYKGDGVVIDAPLKYNTFGIPVILDGRPAGEWGLDLGAAGSSLFYQFAQANGYADKPGVFSVSTGLSSAYIEKTVQFDRIDICGFILKKPLLSIPLSTGKGADAMGERSGNLGNSIWQHFILFLDYDHQQIILERGRDFAKKFPEDKSGMVIGLGEDLLPMVSYVAPGTPAESAGFLAGDSILMINGLPVAQYGGVVPIKKLLRGTSGTDHLFQLQRGSEIIERTVRLHELF
jgi:hypothetical protein